MVTTTSKRQMSTVEANFAMFCIPGCLNHITVEHFVFSKEVVEILRVLLKKQVDLPVHLPQEASN